CRKHCFECCKRDIEHVRTLGFAARSETRRTCELAISFRPLLVGASWFDVAAVCAWSMAVSTVRSHVFRFSRCSIEMRCCAGKRSIHCFLRSLPPVLRCKRGQKGVLSCCAVCVSHRAV